MHMIIERMKIITYVGDTFAHLLLDFQKEVITKHL